MSKADGDQVSDRFANHNRRLNLKYRVLIFIIAVCSFVFVLHSGECRLRQVKQLHLADYRFPLKKNFCMRPCQFPNFKASLKTQVFFCITS